MGKPKITATQHDTIKCVKADAVSANDCSVVSQWESKSKIKRIGSFCEGGDIMPMLTAKELQSVPGPASLETATNILADLIQKNLHLAFLLESTLTSLQEEPQEDATSLQDTIAEYPRLKDRLDTLIEALATANIQLKDILDRCRDALGNVKITM